MTEMKSSRKLFMLGLLGVFFVGLLLNYLPGRRGMSGPMALAVTPVPPGKEQATFAGGCFWSMEAIFKQLKGVIKVEPGYSGGKLANPSYEQVETGTTGHAESLRIIYNPQVIAYRDLLRVFFTMRDPTTPNRQGYDEGPQYRSIVFFHNVQQKQAARQVMAEVTQEKLWKNPIVTELVPFSRFYRAEDYHLDYYRLHPNQPYCRSVIAPEIAEFRSKFKKMLKP